MHASACGDPNCPSSNCHKVKTLFIHGLNCQLKATGGCALCRRMWTLLQARRGRGRAGGLRGLRAAVVPNVLTLLTRLRAQVHAKGCQISQCPVPRCRDLKDYKRRAAEKQDAHRRAAFAAYRAAEKRGGQ